MKGLTHGENEKLKDLVKDADCVITIKNMPNDQVEIVCTPSAERVSEMIKSGHDTTNAHGFMLSMVNAARGVSAKFDPSNNKRIVAPGKRKLLV